MPSTKSAAKSQKRGKKSTSFRIGRVRAYLRGRVWYLCYHEHGKRHQPRVGHFRLSPEQEGRNLKKTATKSNSESMLKANCIWNL